MKAYVSCTLWDGQASTALDDAALLIGAGVIQAVGRTQDILAAADPSTDVVDLGGMFVMPGLIDAHVHLQFPLRATGDFLLSMVEPIEFSTLKAARNAQVYLAAGVTTVMDCGSRGGMGVALREAVERRVMIGPRIVASGIPISPTGGWADDEAEFVHNAFSQGVTADTQNEWRREIRRQAKSGVDIIKIGVSGSAIAPYSDPDLSDMNFDEIQMVVELAHASGCRVAAHCHPAKGFVDGVAAGVDTIHHGQGMDERCITALLEGTTYFVPTALKSQALAQDGLAAGRPPEVVARVRDHFERYVEVLGKCVGAGLADKMAVGSDAGNLPPPHGTTARELAIFLRAGMTPIQALASATGVAAKAVGRSDIGVLSSGRLADFLVVDGDPTRDPTVLEDREHIRSVYKGGAIVAERGIVTERLDLDQPLHPEPFFARKERRRRGHQLQQ